MEVSFRDFFNFLKKNFHFTFLLPVWGGGEGGQLGVSGYRRGIFSNGSLIFSQLESNRELVGRRVAVIYGCGFLYTLHN